MKILITGGGCKEYIDSVRVVTNSSTGRTSAVLSDEFSSNGCEVTLITAKSAVKPGSSSIKLRLFETGAELSLAIKEELTSSRYDAVIHAAAVSDFVPETILIAGETIKAGKNAKKLPSGGEMTVTFKASPKIADSLHEWAGLGGNRDAKVVCFKLLNNAGDEAKQKAVKSLFGHSKADFVVYNDLSQITMETHPFVILNAEGKICGEGTTNESLAAELLRILGEYTA